MSESYDQDLFLGYVEGDLSPKETVRFEQQLRQDARLRNLVAQLMGDRQSLRMVPREKAPPELMEAINQRLERHMLLEHPDDEGPAALPTSRFGLWLAWGSIAALVVVSATVVILILNQSLFQPAGPTAQSIAMERRAEQAAKAPIDPPAPSQVDSLAASPMAAAETEATDEAPLPKIAAATTGEAEPPDAQSVIDSLFSDMAQAAKSARASDRAAQDADEPDLEPTPDPSHGYRIVGANAAEYEKLAVLSQDMPADAYLLPADLGDSPLAVLDSTDVGNAELGEVSVAEAREWGVGLGKDEEAPTTPPTPTARIEVVSDDAGAAQMQLLSWAAERALTVRMASTRDEDTAVWTLRTEPSGRSVDADSSHDQRQLVSLTVPADQLPALLAHLDAPVGQSAILARGGSALSITRGGRDDRAGGLGVPRLANRAASTESSRLSRAQPAAPSDVNGRLVGRTEAAQGSAGVESESKRTGLADAGARVVEDAQTQAPVAKRRASVRTAGAAPIDVQVVIRPRSTVPEAPSTLLRIREKTDQGGQPNTGER